MRAASANERIGRSEIGGSDAHVKQAVGGAVTLFESSSARALRKAIERGRTMARLRRPSAVALGRYIAWGLTPRPYPAREAV